VRYAVPVLEPPIPKSVRFAEAPAAGRTVLRTAPSSPGAEAYREHARRLVASADRPAAQVPT
jgi:chromosome partitioning protein